MILAVTVPLALLAAFAAVSASAETAFPPFGRAVGVHERFDDAVAIGEGPADFSVSVRPVLTNSLDGAWEVDLATASPLAEATLCDLDGGNPRGPFTLGRFTVVAPPLWSDERPDCLRLRMATAKGGREALVRFCVHETRDGAFWLNGRQVDLRVGDVASAALTPASSATARAAAFRALRAAGCNAAYADGLPGGALFAAECFLSGLLPVARGDRVATDSGDVLAEDDPLRPLKRHRNRRWAAGVAGQFGRISVTNRNAFTDATGVALEWTLLVDGEKSGSGEIDLCALAPRTAARFDLPDEVAKARAGSGSVSLRFAFVRDGETIAEDQADFPPDRDLAPFADGEGEVAFAATERGPSFSAGGRRYVFDRETGLPRSVARTGLFRDRELLSRPFALYCAEADGPRALVAHAASFSPVEREGGSLTFTAIVEGLDPYSLEPRIRLAVRWRVTADGSLSFLSRTERVALSGSARVGLAFAPAGDGAEVEWFGLGPEPNGPGWTEGAFVGRWRDADFAGGREGVRGARFGELAFRSLAAPFAIASVGGKAGEGRAFAIVSDGALAFALTPGARALTPRAPEGDISLPGFETESETSEKEGMNQ